MYVVTKEKVARIPVEWNELDAGGFQVTNAIFMKVDLVPLDDFEAFIGAFSGLQAPEGAAPAPTVREFVHRVARGWDGIVGEDKKPFAFTKAHLDVMLQAPGFQLGFGLSYIKAWNGQGGIRRKNSASSAAAGPAAEQPNRKARRARSSSSRR